jgi:hypothetical protein
MPVELVELAEPRSFPELAPRGSNLPQPGLRLFFLFFLLQGYLVVLVAHAWLVMP